MVFLENNPETGSSTIFPKLIEMIKSAEKSVFLSSFWIQSIDLCNTLLEKAEQLNGHVYILTNTERQANIYRIKQYEGPVEDYNTMALNYLSSGRTKYNAAIEVRGNDYIHAKFCVVDLEKVIITSANFRDWSLKITGERATPEIGVYFENKKIALELAQLFRHAFFSHKSERYRFMGAPRGFLDQSPDISIELPMRPHNYSEPNLIWTYDIKSIDTNYGFFRRTILYSIKGLIERSRKNIDLMAWSFDDTFIRSSQWNDIKKKIENNKNYKVRLLIRRISPNYDVKRQLRILSNRFSDQFEVRFSKQNHAKAIITDQPVFEMFTANFSLWLGLMNNFEVGLHYPYRDNIYDSIVDYFNTYWTLGEPLRQ